MSAFATSHALLRQGGTVAVFPEGISHDETTLQPLKTGAARIALETLDEGGAEDLVTVAVGLVYDAKARFRSRALVRVGEPVAVAQWAEDYRRDEWATVQSVTGDLGEQLSRVNPSFASWTQAKQLSWIAEVLVRAPGGSGPGRGDAGRQGRGGGAAGGETGRVPGRAGRPLSRAFALYERDLNLLGVNDAQLVARQPRRRRLALLRSALVLLVALPFAAAGALVHLVPFQIMKQVGKRPKNEGIRATVKVLGCFVLFALTYAVLGVLVGLAFGAVGRPGGGGRRARGAATWRCGSVSG